MVYRLQKLLVFVTVFSGLTLSIYADVIVNDAKPVTHRVVVNRIRTLNTNGMAATVFGNASQEADIIDKINRIWAQAGVEIFFEETEDFINNFAYDNNGQDRNIRRSQSHLEQILNLPGTSTGVSEVDIDMFFVELCPGFEGVPPRVVVGLAWIDSPGTTVHVGASLPFSSGGRDAIASVVAHEIGHNLALSHTANNIGNLMSPRGSSEQLTLSQINQVFMDSPSWIDGFDLLEVIPVDSNYESYVNEFSLTGGITDDDDGDGLSNLIEFALGTNPSTQSNQLPPVLETGVNQYSWTIPKNPEALEDGIDYTIQVSNSLGNWENAGTPGTNTTLVANSTTQISARFNSGSRGFFQLGLTNPVVAAQRRLTPEFEAELLLNDRLDRGSEQIEKLCGCGEEH